ncbi:hypothetical protein MRX96_019616 [Rhipicephalus microplus]
MHPQPSACIRRYPEAPKTFKKRRQHFFHSALEGVRVDLSFLKGLDYHGALIPIGIETSVTKLSVEAVGLGLGHGAPVVYEANTIADACHVPLRAEEAPSRNIPRKDRRPNGGEQAPNHAVMHLEG